MKEVIAIIRPERSKHTREALEVPGVQELYSHRVLGRGRQGGLRYLTLSPRGGERRVQYLPKQIVAWLIPDDKLKDMITAIIQTNQTGNIGDGKIIVSSVEHIPDATGP